MWTVTRQSLGIVLAIGFISLFAGLLYLAPLAFRVARARFGAAASERPAFLRTRLASRIGGVVTILAGCGFMAWSWHDAHAQRFFFLKMAAMGPCLVGIGLWLVIEGPELPANKPSLLGWGLTMLGLAVGLLYVEFLRTGRVPFTG